MTDCDCGLEEGHLYDCAVSEAERIQRAVEAEREAIVAAIEYQRVVLHEHGQVSCATCLLWCLETIRKRGK